MSTESKILVQYIQYAIKREVVVLFCWYGNTHPIFISSLAVEETFSSMKSAETKEAHSFWDVQILKKKHWPQFRKVH